MEDQVEKVYVAIGNDLEDGLGTLEWLLRKWPPYSLHIVIIYSDHSNMGKDHHVLTPFGKLPKSLLNDEKLDGLRKFEMDKTLSKYIAYCAKVKLEILNIDKYDEPLQNIILELISGVRISKLVMGFTFLKSSTWRSRNEMTGPFFIQQKKPDFCEFFVIYGGRSVFLREEGNEGFIEDDQGNLVAKVGKRSSFKGWFGKMFQDNSGTGKSAPCSPSQLTTIDLTNQWEKYVEEIETYINQLLTSNEDEQDGEVANGILYNNLKEDQDIKETMSAEEKVEAMKMKLGRAQEAIKLYRGEAGISVERQKKAEWAISLCIQQAEELEARAKRELVNRTKQMKDLDARKEELHEIRTEVVERKRQLTSKLGLQVKLSNKLTSSASSISNLEGILQNTATKNADVVREIEVLRKQRDIIHRRIEFCIEKNAVASMDDLNFNYKEFTPEEIRVATDNFSPHFTLKSGGKCTNMYMGRIIATTVAIKSMLHLSMDEETFRTKVKLLCEVRHPNIIAVLGVCMQLRCIVFEYVYNGCLRDTLFSSSRSGSKTNQGLNWHARICIAAEICSGLAFLHQAQPRSIFHGNLDPSKILLDRNNVAKIQSSGLVYCTNEFDFKSDIQALGNLILQLLTGRNWAGLVDEDTILTDQLALVALLDETTGDWPLDIATELGRIAVRCLSSDNENYGAGTAMGELNEVRKLADGLLENGGEYDRATTEESGTIPSAFICPIYQDIMKEPYLAADGFSYELEAIQEWLGTGHDTSPMTNLQLKHKHLTPNHTLQFLIQDWHCKTSFPPA
ncbi:putative U-box domain-containing protein 50 [Apium graveolens]|uniref:putative U-box domain-containing protein 50 n=1 Tax=Apium graveolens TaxID=4045 RepID=UPI003D7A8969